MEKARLARNGGEEMDLFGESVSISGDYAVVGVPGHDVWPYINSGSAFVYRRDGENWTEQAMLVADDAGGGDDFGHSVAIDGDYIIVGAPGDDPQSSAYVFMRNGADWT
ncbi:MAG TPA: FG-GAP repeat protein, partial [Armatimonadota bacterium]|nr:FG-GAP repeat protein [Armatimonadota bacterium]